MDVIAEISKKNDELGYGFACVKGSEDIFFSMDTEYIGTSFSDLQVGQKVRLQVSETSRGLFAKVVEIKGEKQKSIPSEVSL